MTKIIDIEERKQRKKEYNRNYFKVYYKENREAFRWYAKKYRTIHWELIKKRKHDWYVKNKEKVKATQTIYKEKKKKEKANGLQGNIISG